MKASYKKYSIDVFLYPIRAILNGYSIIEFGTGYPAPYIWFIYWLITWDDPKDVWADFSLKNVRVRFMPE